jgi:transcriptional regulator with XRE-family HTH domain
MEDRQRLRRGRPSKPLNPGSSRAAHLGTEIRRWRLRRGFSQAQLAELTEFSRQHVGEVERGVGSVSETFVAICDAVLQAGGELKALLPGVVCEQAWTRHRRQARRRRLPESCAAAIRGQEVEDDFLLTPSLPHRGEGGEDTVPAARWRAYQDLSALELLEVVTRVAGDETDGEGARTSVQGHTTKWEDRLLMAFPRGLGGMDRREFFGYLSSATAAFLATSWVPSDGPERLSSVSRLDEVAIEHLEQMTVLFRRSMQEVRLPTRIQIGDALAQVKRLMAFDPRSQSEPLRRRLIGLVGESALLTGILFAWGPSDYVASGAYLDIARTAAGEAKLTELEAMALAYWSLQASYSGRYADALPAAEESYGLAVRGGTGITRAYAASTAAQMYARMGKDDQCRRRLEDAKQALGLGADTSQPWIGFGSFDGSTLAAIEGSCLATLGRSAEALGVLRQANSQTDSSQWHHAWTTANMAIACTRESEVEEGCQLASQAVALGVRTEDAEPIRMIRELYAGALQEYRHDPPVKNLGAQLRELAESRRGR